jgi:hypothetical protein
MQIAFMQLEIVIRVDNVLTFLETDCIWEKLPSAFLMQLVQQTTHAKDSSTSEAKMMISYPRSIMPWISFFAREVGQARQEQIHREDFAHEAEEVL